MYYVLCDLSSPQRQVVYRWNDLRTLILSTFLPVFSVRISNCSCLCLPHRTFVCFKIRETLPGHDVTVRHLHHDKQNALCEDKESRKTRPHIRTDITQCGTQIDSRETLHQPQHLFRNLPAIVSLTSDIVRHCETLWRVFPFLQQDSFS